MPLVYENRASPFGTFKRTKRLRAKCPKSVIGGLFDANLLRIGESNVWKAPIARGMKYE